MIFFYFPGVAPEVEYAAGFFDLAKLKFSENFPGDGFEFK